MRKQRGSWRPTAGLFTVVFLSVILMGPAVRSHSPDIYTGPPIPNVEPAPVDDWCIGVAPRVEDSGAVLSCGVCTATNPINSDCTAVVTPYACCRGAGIGVCDNLACNAAGDCPPAAGVSCTPGSKTETAYWDNRTDGAVNDLASVASTTDANNLYFAAQLWVDPDPASLPLGQIAIDFKQGGLSVWYDPKDKLVRPGTCSGFTDRACVEEDDCSFCTVETEPSPSTRLKTCGSGCDNQVPMNICDASQTCEGIGEAVVPGLGNVAAPLVKADLLIVLDFSFWLTGGQAVLLMEPGTTIIPSSPWDPVTGCDPDFIGDNDFCDFLIAVDPGQSGASSGPPGKVEFGIPFADILNAATPITAGDPYRFSILAARGAGIGVFDFAPNAGIEDILSETSAQATSTTLASCPGFGTGSVTCELADNSSDAFVPRSALPHELPAGGRVGGLRVNKAAASDIRLDWGSSCSTADGFYGVYEGTIASLPVYDHSPSTAPGLCAVTGNTATFTPAAGSRYYLIVPNDGSAEGSYGESSTGGERPQGFSPCETTQTLGTCP